MAKDAHRNEADASRRVYRASDVHKRRARGKERVSDAVEAPAGDSPEALTEPAAQPPATETSDVIEEAADERAGDVAPAEADEATASDAAVTAAISPGDDEDDADEEGEAGDSEGAEGGADDGDGPTDDEAADGAEDDEGDALGQEGLGKRRHIALRITGIVLAIAAAVCLVLLGVFIANRWLIHDDKASMVGEWRIADSSATVVITEDAIKLNDETSYEYDIDPTAKTINYRFVNLEGHGRYWFSDDRNTLIITDGEGYTMWSTALDDLAHAIRAVGDDTLPAGDDSIILRK